jgi:hypothetical protein
MSTPVPNRIRFKCQTCDEWHEGLPSPAWDYPIQYLMVPVPERADRVQLTTDTCVIDGDQFFVRANLPIHVHHSDEPLTWGIWVSLSRASFERFQQHFDDESRVTGEAFFGWLCAAIPGYPNTQLLKTRIHIQPWPNRPLAELESTDHPLSVDYHNGISAARAVELVQPFVDRVEAQ